MAYSTYTTEAIVCGTHNRQTTDRSFLLFTRDGGMLYAEARGVRRERSKQRPALQDFSRIRVSLIHGKAGWRIGSVESLQNYYADAVDRAARGSVVALVKVVRRFARGEEPMVAVYDYIVAALALLAQPSSVRLFFDTYVQVHFLALLGYVAIDTLPAPLRRLDLENLYTIATPDHLAYLSTTLESAIAHSHL
jgi:recombinational DNA repair protein (RecF pathway)